MPESVVPLIAVGVVIVLFIVLLSVLTNNYSLNGIKSKTVGDGQHGTARWATTQEIKKSYASVPFDVASWRAGKNLPEVQGLILGSTQRGKQLDALVDRDDVHCLMIGASGVGKTAFFLYPNLEFACASGMSYLALDTKGDLARNYGTIAQKYYGYRVSVVDLRNPTRSDGSNLLTLINRKAAYRVRVQAGAGASRAQRSGQENRLSGFDGQPALDAQSQMVRRCGTQHIGTRHGICHVHGSFSLECFSGFRAGAGALL